VSPSISKCHCSTAKQGPVKPGQCWQTAAVSCFQAGYPALDSSAPASQCAHTVTSTAPATSAAHPAKHRQSSFSSNGLCNTARIHNDTSLWQMKLFMDSINEHPFLLKLQTLKKESTLTTNFIIRVQNVLHLLTKPCKTNHFKFYV
jgi:hypothetical protein